MAVGGNTTDISVECLLVAHEPGVIGLVGGNYTSTQISNPGLCDELTQSFDVMRIIGMFCSRIGAHEIIGAFQFQPVLLQGEIVDGESVTASVVGGSLPEIILVYQFHIIREAVMKGAAQF